MKPRVTLPQLAGQGTEYVIRLEQFEGPLELLLHLIERQQLEITAISIAQVTDQYLAYLEQAQDVPPAKLADFVALAARLLVIKSRALLPQPPAAEEEEEPDPGVALAQQLRLYKALRDVARWLEARTRTGLRSYVRENVRPPVLQPLAPGAATLDDLVRAFHEVLATHAVTPVELTVLTPHPVTLEEKLTELRSWLRRESRLAFAAILQRARHRQEIVVAFLALLELMRLGEVDVSQERLFGPIIVEWKGESGETPATAGGGNSNDRGSSSPR